MRRTPFLIALLLCLPASSAAAQSSLAGAQRRCRRGFHLMRSERTAAAAEALDAGLELLEHRRYEGDAARRLYAACAYNRGRVAESQGRRGEARAFYAASLHLRQSRIVRARWDALAPEGARAPWTVPRDFWPFLQARGARVLSLTRDASGRPVALLERRTWTEEESFEDSESHLTLELAFRERGGWREQPILEAYGDYQSGTEIEGHTLLRSGRSGDGLALRLSSTHEDMGPGDRARSSRSHLVLCRRAGELRCGSILVYESSEAIYAQDEESELELGYQLLPGGRVRFRARSNAEDLPEDMRALVGTHSVEALIRSNPVRIGDR